MKAIDNTWNNNFIKSLQNKFPRKIQLTQALTDLLCIEREAVYRRLRKEVVFPAQEIVKIASAWNISLDEITGINAEKILFHLKHVNFINPSDEEYDYLMLLIESFKKLRNYPDAELMNVNNKIPRQLISGYRNLTKFYYLRWAYNNGMEEEIAPFSKVVLSDKVIRLTTEYYRACKFVPNTNYIWDSNLFHYLVNNIHYFHSINLITDEDKKLIKQDLEALLDYMLEVAHKGCYPETQNKVNLYISVLNIDTNYVYAYSPEINFCTVNAFGKNEIFSYNPEMIANFISWMQLKKKTSIQISEVDEKSRIEFFTKQKQWIESL
ncbi:MAG: hypothetical protein LBU83_05685 [Bacteroidales bacterium]|jgi:hypothetical protein|nr:hypothetical protein [Bacteroidales bacterium]